MSEKLAASRNLQFPSHQQPHGLGPPEPVLSSQSPNPIVWRPGPEPSISLRAKDLSGSSDDHPLIPADMEEPPSEPPAPRPNNDVSSTRLYVGNLPRDVTKEEVSEHFKTHGTGTITEIKVMNGFGFVEYEEELDARDVVPAFHGTELKGSRLTVQFARGARQRENFQTNEHRPGPRPRRTAFRMQLTGLAEGTSWQDLKDFARRSGVEVVYSEVSRDRDGRGFVEYESSTDLRTAVEKLDNNEFKGANVHCVADEQAEAPSYGAGHRYRSRSPRARGSYGAPPHDDYYGRGRGPPRGYSPRRDDYRRRSPPRDEYYADYRRRSPPRMRGPPTDEPYPAARGGAYRDDPYAHGPPPPRGYRGEDPYANGYDRTAPRRTPPPRSAGYGGYDERPPRAYW